MEVQVYLIQNTLFIGLSKWSLRLKPFKQSGQMNSFLRVGQQMSLQHTGAGKHLTAVMVVTDFFDSPAAAGWLALESFSQFGQVQ